MTKYFVQLSGDALAFFQAENKTKEAAEVEKIRPAAGPGRGTDPVRGRVHFVSTQPTDRLCRSGYRPSRTNARTAAANSSGAV